jgi:hypothetical protein
MNPYPFELLNHFTVPRTSIALLNRDFEISLPGARDSHAVEIRIARSVPETKSQSIEHSSFIAKINVS